MINFQELQPCIVAMANMLPAFQRRVCPQDEEALENPEEFDKIESGTSLALCHPASER